MQRPHDPQRPLMCLVETSMRSSDHRLARSPIAADACRDGGSISRSRITKLRYALASPDLVHALFAPLEGSRHCQGRPTADTAHRLCPHHVLGVSFPIVAFLQMTAENRAGKG